MNEILALKVQMTSLDLSDITGKRHDSILADIRKEINSFSGQKPLIFKESSYLDSQNKEQSCYIFGKEGAMQLALKYNSITRRKVISKLEELEKVYIPTGNELIALAVIEAQKMLEDKDEVISDLKDENKILAQEKMKWADRKVIEALIKKLGAKIGYPEAWKEFKKELLYNQGINLNLRIANFINVSGRKRSPKTLDMIHNEELRACLRIAIAICKVNNIYIRDVIKKLKEE